MTIQTYMIIFAILFFSSSCTTEPTSSNKEEKAVVFSDYYMYLPLAIGNQWKYQVRYDYGVDGPGDFYIKGIENWEIVFISEDSLSFRMRSEFNGRLVDVDWGYETERAVYNDNVVYYDLKLVENTDNHSLALVIEKCIDCDRYVSLLINVLNTSVVKDSLWLEIGFQDSTNSIISKKYDWRVLEYLIEKSIGLTSIETLYGSWTQTNKIKYQLLSFN